MNYISTKLLPIVIFAVEYIAVLIAEKLSLIIQHNLPGMNGQFYISDLYFYGIIPLVFIFFLYYTKVNERFILYWETLQRTFYAVLYSEIFCVVLLYLFKTSNYVSRAYVVIFFAMAFICLCISRQFLIKTCRRLNLMKEAVVFIGAGKTTQKIIDFTRNNNCFGINVAGLFDETPKIKDITEKYHTFRDLEETKDYIQLYKIRTVIIAVPSMEKERLLNLIEDLQPIVRNLMFVPNIVGMPVFNLEVKRLYENNMVLLGIKNNLAKKTNRRIKRVFDIVLGIMFCTIIVPILAIAAFCIKLDTKGPIFFNSERIGKNGKLFKCYKLRSMYVNADKIFEAYLSKNRQAQEEWNKFQKLKDNDPRLTKVGKFIRKYSIDELPQIFNVLKGEMSLVGPRPYLPREKVLMENWYNDIISVLPGMTGYWQVNGRSNVNFNGRLKMDNWYIRNWSIWIDIELLIRTFKVVINGKGAV
ncbi:sugar transferase [Megamonas hypermegale]|uniref:sugar transferase n=1 Tax=Megamonas hypermegale TaxID=158847 RepID=UPI0025A424A6|nr:sugar transferase [Megamonas hypermegale]MDM8142647.1 sugar transferase [Megamonas hypermegale]